MNFKVGDEVVVIAGSNKGKKGKIIKTLKAENKVVVEGVNIVKKHTRESANSTGGIIEVEAPINASNVMIVDPKTKRRRVKYEPPKRKILKRSCSKFTKETQL